MIYDKTLTINMSKILSWTFNLLSNSNFVLRKLKKPNDDLFTSFSDQDNERT